MIQMKNMLTLKNLVLSFNLPSRQANKAIVEEWEKVTTDKN